VVVVDAVEEDKDASGASTQDRPTKRRMGFYFHEKGQTAARDKNA
jgi:hypothetical protein